jgi:hypothetical protein
MLTVRAARVLFVLGLALPLACGVPRSDERVASVPQLRHPTPAEVQRYGVQPTDGVLAVLNEIPGKPHDYVETEFAWQPYVIHFSCRGEALLIQELFDHEPGGHTQSSTDGRCEDQVMPSQLIARAEAYPGEPDRLPELGGRAELSVVAELAEPGWGVMLVVKSHDETPISGNSRPPTRAEIELFDLGDDATVLVGASRDPRKPALPRAIGFPFQPFRVLVRCSIDSLTPASEIPGPGEEFIEIREASQSEEGLPLESVRPFYCSGDGFSGEVGASREFHWRGQQPASDEPVFVSVYPVYEVDWSILVVAADTERQ